MTMFQSAPQRPEQYRRFEHETPQWYRDAKFGIFVHWGAYSVPAWAEPIGELGAVDPEEWQAHSPYSEWYANTIRIEGSPAQLHQEAEYGGAAYEDFLDQWKAEAFEATRLVTLFQRAGARYVVPTTKHHDGIALWDAPGTGTFNTVRRGPHRDLVAEFEQATRAAGLRFGVYYSGGLDWHATDLPPIMSGADVTRVRPLDATYNAYAFAHVKDLIERYHPDVLWGDIEWPDAGKPAGPASFVELLDAFYAATPDGVVNDRFGLTHWDFRTSEYQLGAEVEGDQMWENCRGIGYSFGFNRLETAEHYLDGAAGVRHLVDVVSRGGNLLLNVGPDAAGRIPPLQRRCLEQIGDWMALNAAAVHDTRPVPESVARPGDGPWVRWTARPGALHAVVDAAGRVPLDIDPAAVDLGSARLLGGSPVKVSADGPAVSAELPDRGGRAPQVVIFDCRGDA